MKKQYKSTFVIFGAVILSTLAIQASDFARQIDSNVTKLLTSSVADSVCEQGSVLVHVTGGSLCVDQFEASTSDNCPIVLPDSQRQTQENMNEFTCSSVSKKEVLPWRFVSLAQAQQLCARSNKRLPTAQEWYAVALSQGDQSGCVLNSKTPKTTGGRTCTTGTGIFDMVGNVWEWVDGQVVDGSYNEQVLPDSGFVSLVDSQGIVLKTASQSVAEYDLDYAMTNSEGVYGVIKGGFYNSGEDGGIFAQNLAVPLNLRTNGIGFRCVKDI